MSMEYAILEHRECIVKEAMLHFRNNNWTHEWADGQSMDSEFFRGGLIYIIHMERKSEHSVFFTLSLTACRESNITSEFELLAEKDDEQNGEDERRENTMRNMVAALADADWGGY